MVKLKYSMDSRLYSCSLTLSIKQNIFDDFPINFLYFIDFPIIFFWNFSGNPVYRIRIKSSSENCYIAAIQCVPPIVYYNQFVFYYSCVENFPLRVRR